MSARRPAHRVAHTACPYAATNWADCDAASAHRAHRWGRCTAMIAAKGEPHTCTKWAVAEDGWCGQHYISFHEKVASKARETARQLQLNHDIDAFMAKAARPDYEWWTGLATQAQSTVGLAGIEGGRVLDREAPMGDASLTHRPALAVQPTTTRKGPHRLA